MRVSGLIVLALLVLPACQQAQPTRADQRPRLDTSLMAPPESAASAFAAIRAGLEVAANNLANANTPGFKASRVALAENAAEVGGGVRVANITRDMRQGPPIYTARDLDFMISGQGFLRVSTSQARGGIAYTRCGNFSPDADRRLVLTIDRQFTLEPQITVPDEAVPPVLITQDGRVQVVLAGCTEPEDVGQIELVIFANPEGLVPIGNQLYLESAASGQPMAGNPGLDSRGILRQSHLEGSNVEPEFERLTYMRLTQLYQAWSTMTTPHAAANPSLVTAIR